MSDTAYLVLAAGLPFCVGLVGLLFPEKIWKYTSQIESEGAEAPSDTYLRRMRGGGTAMILASVVIIVAAKLA